MAKMIFLTVGSLKNKACLALQEEYLGRIRHYTSCELIEARDATQKIPESENLLKKIGSGDFVVLLDEKGKTVSSTGLAQQIQKWNGQGLKRVVWIVGGAFGVAEEIKKKANLVLSLSSLTLPHELARVVFFEQIYRAFTILKGEKYHHE
ncbi:MAG TPA: 23S rRNA (pseudouridine(1915)-N(3))-methyltransferase RlmH [Deltaproteobacteria bacterium]|nr:MAG: hypothetical protein A2048_04820 [Deltaproteobacteria bacterium GWA2_45_12]HBF13169.1 23S rRNA (pseudouridine(1915)-N(3))-methyltransferase RlmH [Deltaproteobacteria bacterium]